MFFWNVFGHTHVLGQILFEKRLVGKSSEMNFSNSARQSSPGGSSLSFNNLLQALEGAGATRSPDYPEYDDSTDVTGAGVGEKTTTESGLQGENNSTPGIRFNQLEEIVDCFFNCLF